MGKLTNLSKVDEALPMLTKLQRMVLIALDASYEDFLNIKQVLKAVDKNLSEKTIRRALKRLYALGLIVKIPGVKKGRGYMNLYTIKEEE